MSTDPVSTRSWLNANTSHEGFPIYFRRLNISTREYRSLSTVYPNLLVLTQFLTRVKKDGLPEAEYNESLETFDSALIDIFHATDSGIAALIETFAGKRTYYFYVRVGVEASAFLGRFAKRFPTEQIEWKVKPDPEWKLLSGYARDFSFG